MLFSPLLINNLTMAGKLYDVVSFTSQEPNATVFVSSASDSKIGMQFNALLFLHQTIWSLLLYLEKTLPLSLYFSNLLSFTLSKGSIFVLILGWVCIDSMGMLVFGDCSLYIEIIVSVWRVVLHALPLRICKERTVGFLNKFGFLKCMEKRGSTCFSGS